MKLKTSAYHIPVFLYRYGFLILALPLQSFFLKNLNPLISAYVFTADLALVSAVIVCACVSYKHTKAQIQGGKIEITQGILIRTDCTLPPQKTSSLCVTEGPLQKLLGVCKISPVSSRCEPYLYIKQGSLFPLKRSFADCKSEYDFKTKSSNISVLLLSLGFYNAFTSSLALIPILKKLESLSSQEITSEKLIHSYLRAGSYPDFSVLGFTLSVLIILLWGIGVIVTFMRYAGLTVCFLENHFVIRRGLIVRRSVFSRTEQISTVLLRQNLLMILLGRYTGEFRIEAEKGENKVTFLCAAALEKCKKVIRHTRLHTDATIQVTPCPDALWGYTYLPMCLLLGFCVLFISSSIHIPFITVASFGLFVTLWLVGWFFFRLCIFQKCFLAHSNTTLIVGCYKGLTYILAYIPADKIRSIRTTQSLFQRRKKTCNLRIFIKGRKRKSYCIKHIKKEKAAELLKKLCG